MLVSNPSVFRKPIFPYHPGSSLHSWAPGKSHVAMQRSRGIYIIHATCRLQQLSTPPDRNTSPRHESPLESQAKYFNPAEDGCPPWGYHPVLRMQSPPASIGPLLELMVGSYDRYTTVVILLDAPRLRLRVWNNTAIGLIEMDLLEGCYYFWVYFKKNNIW